MNQLCIIAGHIPLGHWLTLEKGYAGIGGSLWSKTPQRKERMSTVTNTFEGRIKFPPIHRRKKGSREYIWLLLFS
jgi:hypothetical protein